MNELIWFKVHSLGQQGDTRAVDSFFLLSNSAFALHDAYANICVFTKQHHIQLIIPKMAYAFLWRFHSFVPYSFMCLSAALSFVCFLSLFQQNRPMPNNITNATVPISISNFHLILLCARVFFVGVYLHILLLMLVVMVVCMKWLREYQHILFIKFCVFNDFFLFFSLCVFYKCAMVMMSKYKHREVEIFIVQLSVSFCCCSLFLRCFFFFKQSKQGCKAIR